MPDPAGCTFAVAKLSGATTIIATERFPHRAAMAKHYGADEVLQCPLDEASAAVKKSTGGRGCDVVFEVAGAVDTPTAAASMCKKGGTLCVVGICAADSVSNAQDRLQTSCSRWDAFADRWRCLSDVGAALDGEACGADDQDGAADEAHLSQMHRHCREGAGRSEVSVPPGTNKNRHRH